MCGRVETIKVNNLFLNKPNTNLQLAVLLNLLHKVQISFSPNMNIFLI